MEELLKVFDLTPRDGQMILIGAVIFFVFWRVIDAAVFKPFLRLYEEREALTSGASVSSKELLEEAAIVTKRYEERLHAARVSAMAERYQMINQAKKEGAQIVSAAETEVQQSVRDSRTTRERSMAESRKKVLAEADPLARSIADRLTQSAAQSALRN